MITCPDPWILLLSRMSCCCILPMTSEMLQYPCSAIASWGFLPHLLRSVAYRADKIENDTLQWPRLFPAPSICLHMLWQNLGYLPNNGAVANAHTICPSIELLPSHSSTPSLLICGSLSSTRCCGKQWGYNRKRQRSQSSLSSRWVSRCCNTV